MKITKSFFILLVFFSLISLNTHCYSLFEKISTYFKNARISAANEMDRKWLNVLYMYDPNVIQENIVTTHIDYFHEIIKCHYQRLLAKKNSSEKIKKVKKTLLVLSSGSTVFWWSFSLWSMLSAFKYKKPNNYAAQIFWGNCFMLYSFFTAINYSKSYSMNDIKIAYHLRRDEHLLQQFEHYKAISNK